jgi:long-chain acyl-CoA synthetase
VRRRFIAEKYEVLLDAMYGGRNEQFIETMVKFEDGRTGRISANLKVCDARVYTPLKAAA